LRARLAHGELPIAETISILRDVARALEYAHSQGIAHRDIKPDNVLIAGTSAVVADLGVAKALVAARTDGSEPEHPDEFRHMTLTTAGVALGTPAYMAPEQAAGDPATDTRADIYSFGVVAYEMLAGQPPFAGRSVPGILAAHVTEVPRPITSVRPSTPAPLAELVARCLEKRPGDRPQSTRELARALDAIAITADASRPFISSKRVSASRVVWFVAALAVVAGGIAAYLKLHEASPGNVLRVSLSAPGALTPQISATVSPNGKQVAFVAADSAGKAVLWVRELDQLDAKAIPGTQRAAHPFWSPDGRSIGFIADNQIKRVELSGGQPQAITPTGTRMGPAWGSTDSIVFTPRYDEFAVVSAAGGAVRTVMKADARRGEVVFGWPRFLPDGRHFIYFSSNRFPDSTGIYVASLGSSEKKFILRNDLQAWYAPPGYLVFARDETIMAQPFDARRLELSGQAMPVAEGVWSIRGAARASFSVSDNGVLAYVNATLWNAELDWFDRTGRPLGSVGPAVRREGLTPQISPDGRRVAVARGEFLGAAFYVLGTSGEAARRLTFASDGIGAPVWSNDGRRVMLTTGSRLLLKDVDSGTEQVVMDSMPDALLDWSRDGRFAVFEHVGSRTHLWVAQFGRDTSVAPFITTAYNETQGQISPNGHWIAYTSNESGRDEVYVQSFPVAGRKQQVSIDGGVMPRWRRDGRELFYLAANQFLTAVPIGDPTSLTLGRPAPLFRTRLVVEGSESTGLPTTYDVSGDGQRFLLRYRPTDPGPPMTVVTNWLGALKK
jgi:Tol biopolymer transport system component